MYDRNILLEDSSSISKTAVPYFCLPAKLIFVSEVVIPVVVLDPAELLSTFSPKKVRGIIE